MSDLTVADQMAFENLPEETKELARKYYEAKILELESQVEEAYEDGYEKGYASGNVECDCGDEYDNGYDNGYAAGQAEAEDKYESEIQELKERIAELEDAAGND